ncbi:MAG: hypothetical protein M1321_01670 [Candidatus Marsarchaeota archaeon]|jgi:hypothetical protein|nr:hypothetical protein [Candidatus Marsarchaeota archaeon]
MEEYKRYNSEKYGISVDYPSGWKAEDGVEAMHLVAVFVPPAQPKAFRSSINLIIEELPKQLTLEEYTAANIKQIQQKIVDNKIVSIDHLDLPCGEASELIYTGKIALQNGDCTWAQIYFVKGNRAYIFTSTSLKSESIYLQALNHMAGSLSIR